MRLNERELQKEFVKRLSDKLYPGLVFCEHPDQTERKRTAVDVMATLPDGTALLIEHTSISTFKDEQKRNKWIEGLRKTAEKYLPERIDGTHRKCFDLIIGWGKLKPGKQQEDFIRRLCGEIRTRTKKLQSIALGQYTTIPGTTLTDNPHAPSVTIIARAAGSEGNGELHLRLLDKRDNDELAGRLACLLSKKLAKLEQSRKDVCQTTRCETILLLENSDVQHMNYELMAGAVSTALTGLTQQSAPVQLPDKLWYAENSGTRNPPYYTLFKTVETGWGNVTVTPEQLVELEESRTNQTPGQ